VGVSDVLAVPYYGPGDIGSAANYSGNMEVTYDRIPKDEVEIRRSSLVTSTDGHVLGHVEALILDRDSRVTHFVLERGHLWGKRDVTIPIGSVTQIETDAVTVGLTKDEVGALPTVHVHRW
jgi:sporulation protein YlmC with PRC-barrel domain